MTESEKAAAGQLYNANHDPAILAHRHRTKIVLHELNQLSPVAQDKKNQLLIKLLGKIGQDFVIEGPFYCDYGDNIEIGHHFYANVNLVILDGAKVTIGHHVFIAPNVSIYTAGHPLDAERRNQGLEYALPVTIGDNVWIGGGVSILPGVNIGNNVVIGAGSVVTQDIPEGVVAVGNPCRVLRTINAQDKKAFEPIKP